MATTTALAVALQGYGAVCGEIATDGICRVLWWSGGPCPLEARARHDGREIEGLTRVEWTSSADLKFTLTCWLRSPPVGDAVDAVGQVVLKLAAAVELSDLYAAGDVGPLVFGRAVARAVRAHGDAGVDVMGALMSSGVLAHVIHRAGSHKSRHHLAAIDAIVALAERAADVPPEVAGSLAIATTCLAEVSPVYGPRFLVRPMAFSAVKALRQAGLVAGDPPYFGPGRPESPRLDHLRNLHHSLMDTHARLGLGDLPRDPEAQRKDLTKRDVFAIVGRSPGPGQRDYLGEAAELLNQILHQDRFASEEQVKRLHAIMAGPGVEPGAYRTDVTVGSDRGFSSYVCFVPPEEIPVAFDHLLRIVHDKAWQETAPLVVQAYLFLSGMVYLIHPFEDANGRTIRLLTTVLLRRAGISKIIPAKHKVMSLEGFFRAL